MNDHRIISVQYDGIAERDVQLFAFTEKDRVIHAWVWDEGEQKWFMAVPGGASARGQLSVPTFPIPGDPHVEMP